MRHRRGRYSKYVRPATVLIDLIIINLFAFFLLPEFEDKLWFYFFISVSWLIGSWITGYYDVFRFTKPVEISEKIFKQFFLQFLMYSAYNGFFTRFAEPKDFIKHGITTIVIITIIKFSVFYLLKIFRKIYGGNLRKAVIIGNGVDVKQLENFFNSKIEYGYNLVKTFDKDDIDISEVLAYVLDKDVDEIYISLHLIKSKYFNEIMTLADNNFKTLKYIPRSEDLGADNYNVEYYDFIPIIPRRTIPLDNIYNKGIKRIFDLLFSVFIIVFVMSWLVPILAILIRLESKGAVFFKQARTGIKDSEFMCYKFRSMYLNEESDNKPAIQNDMRITKIGRFLRKTSLDEFPQFINVLLGDMSIVGPRPHMISSTKIYAKTINGFMIRHMIKPGITGMAQTHGCRGEIKSERDLNNRFKYDLFYLEKWSIFLDVKIIFLTIRNVFKGEEKAY